MTQAEHEIDEISPDIKAQIDAGATGAKHAGPGAPLDDELFVLLIRAAKSLVDCARAELPDESASALTPVHGLAARYLAGRDDVTTVELARHLGITKQSASEVVAVLEKSGTVRRAPHPSDGRARILLLTDEGRARLDEGRRRWLRVEDEWAQLVGREKLAVMREVLEAIIASDGAARLAPESEGSGCAPLCSPRPGAQNGTCVAS